MESTMIRTETTCPPPPPARPARPSGKAGKRDRASGPSARPRGGQPPAGGEQAANARIETDPKNILATAMLELEAQGRVVDAEALGERTSLTTEEIDTHWRAARDRARLRQRASGRRAA
jgi:hypothetical protein